MKIDWAKAFGGVIGTLIGILCMLLIIWAIVATVRAI